MCWGERNLAAGWFLSLDYFTTYLVTTPPIPRSISTDSLTEETMCWDSSCPAFSAPAFRFPALARSAYPPRFHPSTCRKRDRAALPAKSSVHGVEHRTQSEMDGSALRLKLHRTLLISR